ncbi:RUS1 family protein-like protein [Erysiphe neolycopersici]|uniref:RUS1 family protein-like protein n=1 Tax=Erysiphe neolycopersici TaxID=212602 RepID=A0A420HSJ8_9PEZI|nr:RUS1 family protein-like protein [Erysiphe neolycopersici]
MSKIVSSHQQFSISEFDQVGNDVARYIHSTSEEKHRIDVIVSPKNEKSDYVRNLIEVFLPVGFPGSVTADYLPLYLLKIFPGIGVGDSTVSPTSALLLSVLQVSIGRLATVLFAHRLGTSIEPECKMYRFAADILNDSALILDCLSPIFPRVWRLPFWCLSSVLRSTCGVAAGSSKASLSAHFATQGNLGELNAKDSSQETVISLLGMLVGSLLLPYISSQKMTWVWLILLLIIHLRTNYLAVRSICLRTFNRQRANIFFSEVIQKLNNVEPNLLIEKEYSNDSLRNSIWYLDLPSPSYISQKEKIFERDGVLRWKNSSALGYCKLGVSLKSILDCFGCSDVKTGSYSSLHSHQFQQLLNIYKDSGYILCYSKSQKTYLVAIKSHIKSEVEVHLKAWTQALYLAKFELSTDGPDSNSTSLIQAYQRTCKFADQLVNSVISSPSFAKLGWNLEISAMETIPGTRFSYGIRA